MPGRLMGVVKGIPGIEASVPRAEGNKWLVELTTVVDPIFSGWFWYGRLIVPKFEENVLIVSVEIGTWNKLHD